MKLAPITTPQKTKPFAVCDIESMNWTKFLVLGHTNDGKDFVEFRCIKNYLDYLDANETPLEIFAHFGGIFDFLFLIQEIIKHEDLKIKSIVPRGSSIFYFDVVMPHKTITFRDSSALLPYSLKSLAENFKVETKKGEWDHSKTKSVTPELIEYLKSDCHALHQCLTAFYEWPLIKKSGHGFSRASQSLKVFRTYLKEDLYSMSKFESDFCRKAYLGGRTEIFKPFCKSGPLYEYDVTSLYPHVMKENEYPHGDSYFTYIRDKTKLGIFEAEVHCPDMHVPVLGIVREGKFIFPTGRFKGYWTSAELDYAESLGYKIKIMCGVEFKSRKSYFNDFISDLYSIRESSPKNSVSNIISKDLMNHSYGRLGMNLDKENICFDLKEGVKDYITLKADNKNIQLYKESVQLKSFSHVAIAAFVTSYARIHMHKLYSVSPQALFYTDTDSMFTSHAFKHGPGLGELKLEHVWDSACFLLPKTYMARSKTKIKRAMKGFRRNKIEDFTLDDFEHALTGDLRKFRIETESKFATFKTALAQKKLVTMTKASTKQLKAVYNKRIVFKQNGELVTKPIKIEE